MIFFDHMLYNSIEVIPTAFTSPSRQPQQARYCTQQKSGQVQKILAKTFKGFIPIRKIKQ